jgi:hypothetical protein
MSPVFVLRHAGMPFEWLAALGFDDRLVDLADAVRAGAPPGAFLAEYAEQQAVLRARLRDIVGKQRFRAAVLLSNPTVYEGMLRGYLARDPVPDNARFRRVERQLYLYLQRFCGKNETTSDFGPMGYGEVDGGRGLRVHHRPVRRVVQLSRWALEELARAVAREPALRTKIPLHRNVLLANGDGPVARVLAEGPASLSELARQLGLSVKDAVELARPMLADGSVHRGLLHAAEVVDGLRELRTAVAALPQVAARDRWLAELDAFAADCAEFADAAPDRRAALLGVMERRFTELTGVAARRGAGSVYADRLILFEECGSPFRISVGADLAAAVERAVRTGLDISAVHGQRIQRAYQRQVARTEDGPMSLTDYLARARPEGELRSTFAAHNGFEPAEFDGEDVVPAQRYALPDICLLGPDPAAVSAEPTVLLARVHHHLLLNGWLTMFADAPERFDEQVSRWLTGSEQGRATACLATTRRNKGFYRFPGRRVLIVATDHEGRQPTVAASELTVEFDGEQPRLTDRDGHRVLLYPTLADLSTYPPVAALIPTPVLQPRLDRSNRVYLGGAIYQRAGVTLPLAGLPTRGGPDAFLAVRALVSKLGLPRFVFVRVDSERKPLLIDTSSPFAVDLLCHLAKTDDTAFAEEMLPGPDDLWLADADGHYTCELRVQFLRGMHPGADRGGQRELAAAQDQADDRAADP